MPDENKEVERLRKKIRKLEAALDIVADHSGKADCHSSQATQHKKKISSSFRIDGACVIRKGFKRFSWSPICKCIFQFFSLSCAFCFSNITSVNT
ncbi:MAG: hypothetical protein B6245_21415 [Desulfobacteraceae bacterium 4572_88]|nr:MAG: hypothetical protein B6245_21415 [Desulfobacteraceae bacterium 4572_88]RLC21573.1 MAG: hypothetical protein DRI57_02035 [Deltaproteobacteria bacterium]